MLNRQQIESRIPHAGAMCLLDSVQQWDAHSIDCRAALPDAQHPLAGPQGVSAVVAVEYAAQAAAVHGALLDGTEAPRRGMLVTLREVDLAPRTIDVAGDDLSVRAELLSRVPAACMYHFEVLDRQGCIARGRLTVAFQE
jgi:predicted hotdog family 3-hydroxylacyl-ACP dehydratase